MEINGYLKAVSEAEDQRAEILNWVGDILDNIVLNDGVLVATYARRDYFLTKDGKKVFLSDEEMIEDRYQGKVGLLLKCGPDAFRFNGAFDNVARRYGEDDEQYEMRRTIYTPGPGDWVLYRPADGSEVSYRRAIVRIVPSECIKMIVDNPMDWY